MMQSIILHIADINICIRSEVEGIIHRFEEFYRHFTITDTTNIDYTINIKQKKFSISTEIDENNDIFQFQGYAFQCYKNHSHLLIPSIKNAYQYSEEFLLFIFSELCIRDSKLIFHSASLVDNRNNTYIFFGPSGIGKSTISKKLSNYITFSDDMVVIEQTKEGYLLHKTPFERDKHNKEPELVQIKSFYRLIQSDRLENILLTRSKAFNALLANVWFSEYHKESVEKYTAIIKALIKDIPVSELHVSKDNQEEQIVKCIDML